MPPLDPFVVKTFPVITGFGSVKVMPAAGAVPTVNEPPLAAVVVVLIVAETPGLTPMITEPCGRPGGPPSGLGATI